LGTVITAGEADADGPRPRAGRTGPASRNAARQGRNARRAGQLEGGQRITPAKAVIGCVWKLVNRAVSRRRQWTRSGASSPSGRSAFVRSSIARLRRPNGHHGFRQRMSTAVVAVSGSHGFKESGSDTQPFAQWQAMRQSLPYEERELFQMQRLFARRIGGARFDVISRRFRPWSRTSLVFAPVGPLVFTPSAVIVHNRNRPSDDAFRPNQIDVQTIRTRASVSHDAARIRAGRGSAVSVLVRHHVSVRPSWSSVKPTSIRGSATTRRSCSA